MNDRTGPVRVMVGQPPSAQQGAVLFFTLIALVAMTLAALAMVRSVDTSNLVAGNIALKQGAMQEADKVMNTAYACLDTSGGLSGPTVDRGASVATCNYYSFLQPDLLKPYGMPDVLETTTGTTDPLTGNTSAYVIERMCSNAGEWSASTCVESPFGKAPVLTDRAVAALTPPQALYRISIKISGPRNVATYSQMIMNAGT